MNRSRRALPFRDGSHCGLAVLVSKRGGLLDPPGLRGKVLLHALVPKVQLLVAKQARVARRGGRQGAHPRFVSVARLGGRRIEREHVVELCLQYKEQVL